jgi:hypothetical protein
VTGIAHTITYMPAKFLLQFNFFAIYSTNVAFREMFNCKGKKQNVQIALAKRMYVF